MVRRTPTVKQKRAYDASRRREQARRNRDRIIDAAERRFLRDGYAATTIAAIAADAGVSADTIYKSFGGKPGLVRAIREQALARRRPGSRRAAIRRSCTTASRDGRAIIEAWGALTAEVAPRVAPILLLIRAAAATDPEVQALLDEMDADRLRRMTDNARRLRDAGHLRAGHHARPSRRHPLDLQRARALRAARAPPGLVAPTRYGRFVADAMIDALL